MFRPAEEHLRDFDDPDLTPTDRDLVDCILWGLLVGGTIVMIALGALFFFVAAVSRQDRICTGAAGTLAAVVAAVCYTEARKPPG